MRTSTVREKGIPKTCANVELDGKPIEKVFFAKVGLVEAMDVL